MKKLTLSKSLFTILFPARQIIQCDDDFKTIKLLKNQ
jgi:hypothetical protein